MKRPTPEQVRAAMLLLLGEGYGIEVGVAHVDAAHVCNFDRIIIYTGETGYGTSD